MSRIICNSIMKSFMDSFNTLSILQTRRDLALTQFRQANRIRNLSKLRPNFFGLNLLETYLENIFTQSLLRAEEISDKQPKCHSSI
jgi:hypothetical protein